MEVGCGNGNTLRIIKEACKSAIVIGIDMDSQDLKYAQKRDLDNLIQGDIHFPPFANRFDIICLFDVLEHISDDDLVLSKLRHMITDGGYIFLTVPAHPSMWSYADEIVHHYRRYKAEELEGKLIQSGFHVEYISYYMASILPLVWTIRKLKNMMRGSTPQDLTLDERKIVPVANEILTALLVQEARLITRRWRIPFGTSVIVVGKKI
ncbi:class I SAM-dependent methyltransferase [Candidatus Pacearchaeota archaeon]|nr:class I SAM-dependent methyltransferase [Candidatus Pacearchaeota archaeon]